MSMNLPPQFYQQFLDTDGTPLAGGFLYTYVSGTTTNQTTYSDQAGGTTNTNPIVLDSAGRCTMWLDPTLEYDLVLKRSDSTSVVTFSNVSGASVATAVATTVNGLSGTVVLTAADIGFTTGTSTSWFVGTDVSAAIDAVISKVDTTASAQSLGAQAFTTYTGVSTLQLADRGQIHYKTDATNVTVPASVFAAGDVVRIVNGHATTTMNVLQGTSLTLYHGAALTAGARTLAPSEIAEVRFLSATVAFCFGPGVA